MTDDLARVRYLELQRLGRDLGRPTDELLTSYAMEGFLARVSTSRFADRLVLKGGMLMSHLAERRPTRDIDLHTMAISNLAADIEAMVLDVVTDDIDDGVTFDTSTIEMEEIREVAVYPGVRVSMDAYLYTGRLRVKVDLSFGDPVDPQPEQITLQRVHPAMPPLVVLGFPLTMVLAEKIVTAVARGTVNTRWRDLADIIAIVRANEIDGVDVVASISAVSEHRGVELSPISKIIGEYVAVADRRWRTWHTSQTYEVGAPLDFATALEEVAGFADAALTPEAAGLVWRPVHGWMQAD